MEKKPEEKKPEKKEPEKELEGLTAVYAEKDVEKQKKLCIREINKILKENDGLESNIGINSEYWDLTALHRKLSATP